MSAESSTAKKILGVSGSPRKESNTDRALKIALAAAEEAGCQTEFVKLSQYKVEPCRACLGCVETSVCVIEDDGIELAEKAKAADALILACFTPYSSIDGRSKAFLERLYPLRHRKGYMQGKPGGVIVTSAIPHGHDGLPPAAEMGIKAVQFYMMEEGMDFMGAVISRGNVPCISCGFGDACDVSGLKMIFGPEATVDSVGVHRVEDQPEALAAARELGEHIAQVLQNNET